MVSAIAKSRAARRPSTGALVYDRSGFAHLRPPSRGEGPVPRPAASKAPRPHADRESVVLSLVLNSNDAWLPVEFGLGGVRCDRRVQSHGYPV